MNTEQLQQELDKLKQGNDNLKVENERLKAILETEKQAVLTGGKLGLIVRGAKIEQEFLPTRTTVTFHKLRQICLNVMFKG